MTQRRNKFKQRDESGDLVVGDYTEEQNAIYVDPTNGHDGYSGDQNHPVRSLANAIVKATALGGTGRIVLRPGAYAEESITPPTGYTLEGVDRTAVLVTGAGGANPVIILNGAQGGVKNLTVFGNPAQTSLIQLNGAGTYRLENVQLTAGAASAAVGILHTAALATECINVDVNTAGGAATGAALQVVAGTIQFRGCTLQSNNENPISAGTVTLQNSTMTNLNAGGAAQGVVNMTNASTLNIIDSTLNQGAPIAGANGYAVNWGDASAVTINYIGARLQNNGGYVAAAQPLIPESAGGGAIVQNIIGPLYGPIGDVNQGAVGLDGFENGVFPSIWPGINSPLWAGLGGGATPFAGADEYDMWSAIMRIARHLDDVSNTITNAAGLNQPLLGYVGGQIT